MNKDVKGGLAEDRLLLRNMMQQDEDAVESLYKDYYPVARHLVVSNSGTEDDAKDIFQEALIVLYDKAADPTFELHSRLKTYLYAVCRHLWLKRLHQDQRQVRLTETMEEQVPVEEALLKHEEADRQFEIMNEALVALGEPCRTLLEDYYLRKSSMQEIMERYGYTNTDNAKNQKYKCLMRLKKIFFSQYNTQQEE
ncbi:sigma-70 family RNA polymerase sigma factor [Compostibacter hankyongensis]|uniref:RNA polymerase sigma-70 region 2 domain-containing protein n=1 Tax=Compostibacter hankyongensis TaxID=1007089 RepID=A0ABP8FS81_9BACT